MKDNIIGVTSWFGTCMIVLAYTLVSFEIIKPNLTYQIINICGSISIAIVSIHKKVYQPAIINIVCSIIAVIAIVKYIL